MDDPTPSISITYAQVVHLSKAFHIPINSLRALIAATNDRMALTEDRPLPSPAQYIQSYAVGQSASPSPAKAKLSYQATVYPSGNTNKPDVNNPENGPYKSSCHVEAERFLAARKKAGEKRIRKAVDDLRLEEKRRIMEEVESTVGRKWDKWDKRDTAEKVKALQLKLEREERGKLEYMRRVIFELEEVEKPESEKLFTGTSGGSPTPSTSQKQANDTTHPTSLTSASVPAYPPARSEALIAGLQLVENERTKLQQALVKMEEGLASADEKDDVGLMRAMTGVWKEQGFWKESRTEISDYLKFIRGPVNKRKHSDGSDGEEGGDGGGEVEEAGEGVGGGGDGVGGLMNGGGKRRKEGSG